MNKTIHFVRHGQSTWNEAEEIFKFTRFDKEMQKLDKMDAPISSFGEEQAAQLQEKIQALNAEIAITSPLSRAIETCIRSYGVKNVVASHLCAELGDTICDIGMMIETLEKKYPSIDFSCLPSTVWWYVDQKLKDQLTDPRKCYEWVLQNGNCGLGETDCHFHRRIEEFHEFLQSRCESNIIVFTHGAFMRGFFHKYCNRPFRQIVRNVEIITYTL